MPKKVKPAGLALCVLLLAGCADQPDDRRPEDTVPAETAQESEPAERTNEAALPSSSVTAPPPETTAAADPPELPLSAGEAAERQLAAAVFHRTAADGTFTYDLYDTYAAVTGFSDTFLAAYDGEDAALELPAVCENLPVRVIAADAFSAECGVLLSSVTLPEGLWRIGARAFLDQHRITGAVLPESLHSVGEMAFVCRDDGAEHSPMLTMGGRLLPVGREEFRNEKRFDAAY